MGVWVVVSIDYYEFWLWFVLGGGKKLVFN